MFNFFRCADKFELLLMFEYKIYSLWNIFLKANDLFLRNKNILKKNINLKINNQIDDKCILIGNGPSLKNVDLIKLNDKNTFTVNWFYNNEIFKEFKSKYHFIFESNIFSEEGVFGFNKKKSKKYICDIFCKNPSVKLILNFKDFSEINKTFNNVSDFYFLNARYKIINENKLKLDMTRNMTVGDNSLIMSIHLAIYMGYKTIYLLGYDFNYFTGKSEHFNNMNCDISLSRTLGGLSWTFRELDFLQRYAKKNKINIYNATAGSYINVFPKVSFEDMLKCLENK